jgi:hypothetical protein
MFSFIVSGNTLDSVEYFPTSVASERGLALTLQVDFFFMLCELIFALETRVALSTHQRVRIFHFWVGFAVMIQQSWNRNENAIVAFFARKSRFIILLN